MSFNWHQASDQCELADQLSEVVAQELRAAVAARGRAIIAFSGGSTPIPLFQALCRREVPWSSVVMTLVDERWVPESDALSNAALLRKNLLSALPETKFVPLYRSATSVTESLPLVLQDYAQQTHSSISHPASFDVVVLGMGGDGHTASFFPDAENISSLVDIEQEAALLTCESASTQVPRVTWSLPKLLDTGLLALHFTGAEKRKVFEQATQAGAATELPIRAAIHQQHVPLNVFYAE